MTELEVLELAGDVAQTVDVLQAGSGGLETALEKAGEHVPDFVVEFLEWLGGWVPGGGG